MDIQKNYLDVIEWIRSPLTNTKDYHISLVQSCILQRLIKYSRVNQNITYSNKVISEHMFRSLGQIKKNIPVLIKKGLIEKIDSGKSKFGQGKFYKKRNLRINWDKLKEINDEMIEYVNKKNEEKNNIQPDYPLKNDLDYKIIEINTREDRFIIKNENKIHMSYEGHEDHISLFYKKENGSLENSIQTCFKYYYDYLDNQKLDFRDITKYDLLQIRPLQQKIL
jgi:hypothetical protein